MEHPFKVSLEQFNGPLDKLLELIEERKIEITRINLGEVTGDFIKYVEGLGETVFPSVLADFVLVASRLLLIKSKILLPSLELTEEEEEDISDLEHRLKIYREFKEAGRYMKTLWEGNTQRFSRPLLAALGSQAFFFPPRELTTGDLHRALRSLFAVVENLLPQEQKIKIKVVTLQEKITELTGRLENAFRQRFTEIAKEKPRQEIIVMFLAVLHMLAHRLVSVEQEGTFSDIILQKGTSQES